MNDNLSDVRKILQKKNLQNFEVVKKYSGGMSNHTFLIKIENDEYILRVPAKNAKKYLKRKNEKIILNKIKNENITSKTIYLNTRNGIKISSYIKGCNLDSKINYNDLENVVKLVKRLNMIKPSIRLEKENLCKKINNLEKGLNNLASEYFNYKKEIFKYYKKYLKKEKSYLIHNDLQLSNIIKKDDNSYYLIDFEYALKGSIYYEIGALYNDLNLNNVSDFDVIKMYFGSSLDNLKYLKTYIAASLEILRWYLVASIKKNDKIDLGIDFEYVANNFLKYLKYLIERINECAKKGNIKIR